MGGGVEASTEALYGLKEHLKATKAAIKKKREALEIVKDDIRTNRGIGNVASVKNQAKHQRELDTLLFTQRSLEEAISTPDRSNNFLDIARTAYKKSSPGSKEEIKTKKKLNDIISSSQQSVEKLIAMEETILKRKARILEFSGTGVLFSLRKMGYVNCRRADSSRYHDSFCDLGNAVETSHCKDGKCTMKWGDTMSILKKEMDRMEADNDKDKLEIVKKRAEIFKLLGHQDLDSVHQASNLLTDLKNENRYGNVSFQKTLGEKFTDLLMMGFDELQKIAADNSVILADLEKDLNAKLEKSTLGHYIKKQTNLSRKAIITDLERYIKKQTNLSRKAITTDLGGYIKEQTNLSREAIITDTMDIFCYNGQLKNNPCSDRNEDKSIPDLSGRKPTSSKTSEDLMHKSYEK